MIDVATFGEAMVSLRSAGPLTVPGTLTARIAGAESTVAIGLARLGHEVRWVSRVGDDAYGSVLLRPCAASASTCRCRGGPRATHGPHDRGRSYGGHHGCHLLPGGICCLGDQPCRRRPPRARTHPPRERDHARAECECGRGASGGGRVAVGSGGYSLVSLDVNFRSRLWSREQAAATLRPLLPHLSLVIGSEDELPLLAGGGAAELAADGLEVVEKRGARGAAVRPASAAEAIEVPAIPVTAIDVLGAGDAFTAGYLSGVLEDLSPVERLVRGTKVAAFCVSTARRLRGTADPRRAGRSPAQRGCHPPLTRDPLATAQAKPPPHRHSPAFRW